MVQSGKNQPNLREYNFVSASSCRLDIDYEVAVCHPHPVYGGTMDIRIVYRAARVASKALPYKKARKSENAGSASDIIFLNETIRVFSFSRRFRRFFMETTFTLLRLH
jgi:hypothetical protein